MITRILTGERPSRPRDPNKNQWLQDPVWDVIATGWHNNPDWRCELSVMHNTFSCSQQEIQNAKPGD